MTSKAVVLLASLIPAVAVAQGGLGLDLKEPDKDKKEEEQKKEPGADQKKQAPGTSTLDHPLSSGSDQPVLGERDTTAEDRVKSVQRKVYLKKHRFELAPYFTVSLNDAYFSKFGVAIRGAYYLSDTLALSGRFSLMQVLKTNDVRIATSTFQSRIFFSVPQWSAMGDVEWSPIYGKVSIFNSILHFDAYILGGLGVVRTETSARPGQGLNPAADLGFGMRFVATDWLAVNVALIDTFYVDTPTGTTKAETQNLLMLHAGLSLFIPFKSTGREAE